MPSSRTRSARVVLEVERVELPNGLTLLLSEDHATPAVALKVIVNSGSRYETDDKAGLASMVGQLLDEGTLTRTSQQIAATVEAVGGKFGTFGDYQESGAAAVFLAKDLPLALEVTADVLMHATFPEEKVRQEIDRRVAQIKSRLDVPRTRGSDAFNEIVFKGTPQHRPSVGYEETVGRLTRADVSDFYRRTYAPNHAMMSVVGDFDKAAVKRLVGDLFGAWPRALESNLPPVPLPLRQTEAATAYISAPKEQVNIFIGHVGIARRNPDYYALLVLDTILGSSPGFTSRIPRILRDEQGLAYTVFSSITSSAGVDPGRFVAYIGTSPDNLDRAITGLRGEIARIVEEPVSDAELKTAKDYLTGSFVFHFQKNLQIADFLIDAETYALGFDYLEAYPEKIRAITVADITRVARQYLDPEHLTTVVVGPVEEKNL